MFVVSALALKDMIATTISEHIFNQSEIKGKIKGKIELLESFLSTGILTREQFNNAVEPLRLQLQKLLENNSEAEPD